MMNLAISPNPQGQVSPFPFAPPNGTAEPSAPPDAFARLVDEAAAEPKTEQAEEDSDEAKTDPDGRCCVVSMVPPPPVLVPVPLPVTATGNTAVSPPVPESAEGGGTICRLDCFTQAGAPVTESLKSDAETAAEPKPTAAPHPADSQQTSVASSLATIEETPAITREKAPVDLSRMCVHPDIELDDDPVPTPDPRRNEADFAAPAEKDFRRGMVTAEHRVQMKQVTNQDEIARLLEQDLPTPAAWFAAARSPERARDQRVTEGSLAGAEFGACDLAGLEHGAGAMETTPVSDTAPTLSQRLVPLVSAEVRLLKQSGPGELSVLLKPDTHTEIVLHLRTIAGRVEAVVRCEHGDFQALNAEWGQLRESLAPQGVHLLPLSEPPGSTQLRASLPANSASLTDGEQPQRQPHPAPESLDERPLTGAVIGSQHTARKSAGNPHRLLESWA